ncbi:MAG: hypothetical protein ABIQ99_10975 [Thermoflexales bacterium]
MKTKTLFTILLAALTLSACAPGTAPAQTASPAGAPAQANPQTAAAPVVVPTQAVQVRPAALNSGDLVRTDAQGAVQFKVTPLNLENPNETLDFEIDMNTHSVDLGMNVAKLATLTLNNGLTVVATQWEAPGGGHHVAGKLLFPSTVDGISVLKGATSVALTLRNIDAAERRFVWEIE